MRAHYYSKKEYPPRPIYNQSVPFQLLPVFERFDHLDIAHGPIGSTCFSLIPNRAIIIIITTARGVAAVFCSTFCSLGAQVWQILG